MFKALTDRLPPIQEIPDDVHKWYSKVGSQLGGRVYLTELDSVIGVAAAFDFSGGNYPMDEGIDIHAFLYLKAQNLVAHELLEGGTVCMVRGKSTALMVELVVFFPHNTTPAHVRAAFDYADQRMPLREPEYLLFPCCRCPSSQKPDKYTCPKGTPCRFVKRYVDARGWKYRVMGDLAGTYKTRFQKPDKRGENGWKGVPNMERYPTFDEAQTELNKYARRKGWCEYHGKD